VSTKIATRSSSGLRPQGTGGQTVQQAYQAIVHYLRRALSEAHALLLAEPNLSDRGGTIDWYSEASDPAGAVPIGAAPLERRAAIYARLAALMNDIRARAEELKNSSRQSERLLGQMLLLALEIPNEDCLFVVGDQPVLIFWGYLADVSSPQRGVIDRMIAESRRPAQPRPSAEAPRPSVVETPRAEEPPRVAPPPLASSRYRWLPLLLWLVFTALCLVIGLDLLYACGMGLPWQASARPLLIDYCPAATATTEPSRLGELESQNQILQGQLDRLLGAITARRQQCAEAAGGGRQPRPVSDVPTPIPVPTTALPVASETPPPLPEDTPGAPPVALDTPIQIPTETESLASLAGCWGGPSTTKGGQQIQESFCFDETGRGIVTIERPGGIVCKGRLKVRLVKPGPQLVIDRFEGAKCPDGDDFSPIEITCAPDRQGRTRCAGRFEADGGRPWDIELRRLAGPAGQ
jgi:hypothetical protein